MKNLVPVIVTLLLLGVGGYYFMNMKSSKSPVVEQKTATGTTQQGGNIFSSIKDALSKSISLKCDYPNPDGKGGTVTSYIKNGAVRIASIAMGVQGNGSAIMKNNKMWIWDDVKKTGMMLTLDTSKITPGAGAASNDDQQAKVLAEMEKYKSYCKTEVVADSLFTPPADVKFTDLQNLMKGYGVPSGAVPSGIVMPSGVVIPTQPEE